ncbi:WD40-repeat-containing domain protein [Fimicolochytrium jonesii]|uniref:WD40-repeat-containing domain protein n=1 Tax=Fimicolochytrium jonesii TaxID=1396493 RepID=UPI0022FE38EA|nr:WD40-repeat-containing domain protein [Fimicolochytrium jonesii]KAI8818529.1 WD40-repeat-containing domain protein [Fimicolochytrium jonesii]
MSTPLRPRPTSSNALPSSASSTNHHHALFSSPPPLRPTAHHPFENASSPLKAPSPCHGLNDCGRREGDDVELFAMLPLSSPCRGSSNGSRSSISDVGVGHKRPREEPGCVLREMDWKENATGSDEHMDGAPELAENPLNALPVSRPGWRKYPLHYMEQEKPPATGWSPLVRKKPAVSRDSKTLFSGAAWASGKQFAFPLAPHRALVGREMFGGSLRGRIRPSLRRYLTHLVSTEHDIYRTVGEAGVEVPPFACAFKNDASTSNILAVADEDGTIGLINAQHDSRYESHTPRTEWAAHQNAIFDICWSNDDRHIVSASGDQTVRVWDVETQKCVRVFEGNTSSVKCVTRNERNPNIFATAARDGKIMTWDVRCSSFGNDEVAGQYHRPTCTIRNAHSLSSNASKKLRRLTTTPAQSGQSQSVTGVRFIPNVETMLVSSGAADGLLKIWDMRNAVSYSRKDPPVPYASSSPSAGSKRARGFSSFSVSADGSRIYAACTDNNIHAYDAQNLGSPLRTYSASGFRVSTFYIKTALSPDDTFLAAGSSDHNIYVWELDAGEDRPPLVLRAHTGEVTAVSWCGGDFGKLASCADDATIRLWNADLAYDETKQDPAYKSQRGVAEEGQLRKIFSVLDSSSYTLDPQQRRRASPEDDAVTPVRRRDENDEDGPGDGEVDEDAENVPPVLPMAGQGSLGAVPLPVLRPLGIIQAGDVAGMTTIATTPAANTTTPRRAPGTGSSGGSSGVSSTRRPTSTSALRPRSIAEYFAPPNS